MNLEQKEAWMLGYQEVYSTGYDDAYWKGFEEGFLKDQRKGLGRIEFLKVRCSCGYVIMHPILRSEVSVDFRIADDKERHCPNCNTCIPKPTFARAYSEHMRNR